MIIWLVLPSAERDLTLAVVIPKPLNLMLDSEPVVALGGPDEQNSLYFPS
jgi:hypothetical protein